MSTPTHKCNHSFSEKVAKKEIVRNETNVASRNPYFDFLRGIAICCVIGIHTKANTSEPSALSIYSSSLRQLLNIAVPLFIAISGYFLSTKSLQTKQECFAFWKKQVSKVYIPCLIWSIPWVLQGFHHHGFQFSELFFLFLGGVSIYYFITFIIQCYFFLPLFQPFTLRKLLFSALLSALWITLYTYGFVVRGQHWPILFYAGPLPMWIVFFVLGGFLRTAPDFFKTKILYFASFVSLFVILMETKFLNSFGCPGLGQKLSSHVFSFCVITILFSPSFQKNYKRTILSRFLEIVGNLSFGIYLIHNYLVFFVRRFTKVDNWMLTWFIVLCTSMILILICQKILPPKWKRWIGFA